MAKNKLRNKLIDINRVFGGYPVNLGNLDFEVDMATRTKKPFRKAAHLTRAMTAGHSFSDGNKRTAIVATTSELRKAGYKADKRKLVRSMRDLARMQETDLTKIEKRIRRCTRK